MIATIALVAVACPARRPPALELRVGTSGDYAPFSTRRGDELVGLDVEVARRFAHDTGRRLVLVPFRWPDLLADLGARRFDLAMGGVTMRPERAVVGTFARPVVRAGAVVLCRREARPLDEPGVRLVVNAGGHLERLARRLFPAAVLVPTDNRRLLEPVVGDRADGILTDDVEAVLLAAGHPELVRRGPLTRDAKGYLGTDPALVAELDAWLRTREADGTLAALRARWLGHARADLRSAAESDLDALLALVDLRLAFMPPIAAAKVAGGLPVEDPAQEARVVAAAREWAAPAGLAPDGVETLFRELIRAARAVQERFVARPWPVDALDLDREARPALSRVSREIVARAAAVVKGHTTLADATDSTLASRLDPSWSEPATRLAIARAILALRVAGSSITARNGGSVRTSAR